MTTDTTPYDSVATVTVAEMISSSKELADLTREELDQLGFGPLGVDEVNVANVHEAPALYTTPAGDPLSGAPE